MNTNDNISTNCTVTPQMEGQQEPFAMSPSEDQNHNGSLENNLEEEITTQGRHQAKAKNDNKSGENMEKPTKKESEVSDSVQEETYEVPISFPQQLMEMLNNEEHADIISWLPHGKGFQIHKKKTLANEVLPKYFNQSKYTSFTRRLNRWGFVRVTRGPEVGAYYHNLFQRDGDKLILQMSCQKNDRVRAAAAAAARTTAAAAAGDLFLLHYQQSLGNTTPSTTTATPYTSPATVPPCTPSTVAHTLHQQFQQLQYLQYQIRKLEQLQQKMKLAEQQHDHLHQQQGQLNTKNEINAATELKEMDSEQRHLEALKKQLTLQEKLKQQLTLCNQQREKQFENYQTSVSAKPNTSLGGGGTLSGNRDSNSDKKQQQRPQIAPRAANTTSDAPLEQNQILQRNQNRQKELQRLYARSSASKLASSSTSVTASSDSGVSALSKRGLHGGKFLTFSQLQKQQQQVAAERSRSCASNSSSVATQNITSSNSSCGGNAPLKQVSNDLFAHQILLSKEGSGTDMRQAKTTTEVSQQQHIMDLRQQQHHKEEQQQQGIGTNPARRASAA